MKIDTSTILKNLVGESLKEGSEDCTLGMAIGGILLGGEEGGKMKLFTLAQKFYTAKGIVEVDTADFHLIESCVKNTKVSPVLVSGQVELLLAACKSDEKGE